MKRILFGLYLACCVYYPKLVLDFSDARITKKLEHNEAGKENKLPFFKNDFFIIFIIILFFYKAAQFLHCVYCV